MISHQFQAVRTALTPVLGANYLELELRCRQNGTVVVRGLRCSYCIKRLKQSRFKSMGHDNYAIRYTAGLLQQTLVVISDNRAFATYQLCWVGNHVLRVNIMKTTNSPIQGRPNPRKIRSKVATGPLLPTANTFS